MEAKVEPRSQHLVSRNPLTGEKVAEVAILGPEGVKSLVAASRGAQREWTRRSLKERARALDGLRHLIAERADEIAATVRRETGKVTGEALVEVTVACDHLEHLARIVPNALLARRADVGWLSHRRARVAYEPYGVIGAITPWNYPFSLSMGAIATAIAAGNGIVLKPSEYTPLTGRLAAELATEAVGLADLVVLATGDGSTGAALVAAGVDKIFFTGSSATGKKIMAAAAETLTPLVLELGGNDPMIVCADADVERAARGAVWAAFFGCGQVCMSVERAYVVDAIYDKFLQAVLAEARRVRTSDEPEAMVGSMIAPFQVEKVERHIEDAVDKGARIALGGRAIDVPGHFFEPTVVVDVDHSMDLMRSETFGPVLPIMRVADEDEAVRLANESDYGLDASVWSRNHSKARRIAEQLDVGSVLINDHMINYAIADLPFGGRRHSGFGRTHGPEGLREFVRPKSWVEDRLTLRREPYWFEESGSGEELAHALLVYRHGSGPVRRLLAALKLIRRVFR